MKKYLGKKYVISAIVVLIIIVVVLIMTSRGSASTFQSAAVTTGNVIETVSVTGTVSPVSSADLAFEKSGVISSIYVSVGQNVSVGEPIVSLDSAEDQATLESAEATLADMTSSASSEGVKVSSAQTSLSNAETDAVNAAHTAYTETQAALVNYTDSFFMDAQSANPTINIHTQTTDLQNSIDAERLSVTSTLSDWSAELSSTTPDQAATLISGSYNYLSTIKNFMNDLSAIVTALNTSNYGFSQSVITADITTMNSGISALNSAIDAVTGAETELAQSGNSSDSIAAQEAKVAAAQAALSEDTIVSPIDGIVTRADPSVGEFMAAGDSGFAVESSGQFKVEAYVAEADIAKVAVGDFGFFHSRRVWQ